MVETIEIRSCFLWQNAITWYEEKYGRCSWLASESGANVINSLTGDLVAYKTHFPNQYFLVVEYFQKSPWGKKTQ